jgi:hypothetical protein
VLQEVDAGKTLQVAPHEEWTRTPAAKRPKTAHKVENDLAMTPPPVVDQQSATRFANTISFFHLFYN